MSHRHNTEKKKRSIPNFKIGMLRPFYTLLFKIYIFELYGSKSSPSDFI